MEPESRRSPAAVIAGPGARAGRSAAAEPSLPAWSRSLLDTSGSVGRAGPGPGARPRAGRPGAACPRAARSRSSPSTTSRGSCCRGPSSPDEVARAPWGAARGAAATRRCTTRSTTPAATCATRPARARRSSSSRTARDEDSALDLDDGLASRRRRGSPCSRSAWARSEERVLRRIAKLTGGEYLPRGARHGAARSRRASRGADGGGAGRRPPASPARRHARRPTPPARPRPAPPRRAAAGWPRLAVRAARRVVVGGLASRRGRRGSSLACERALRAPHRRACAAARGAHATPTTLTSRTSRPPCSTRMNSTEEYLEKTVTLQRAAGAHHHPRARRRASSFELERGDRARRIGRAKANDIVLKDVAVSSEHCRIRPEDGRFVSTT